MAGGDGRLVSTVEAARQLGISARTIQRYVAAGLITPDLTLPSGQYRWDVDKLRDQINSIPRDRDS
jgi:DNA-binding transcriptional MerR regulator